MPATGTSQITVDSTKERMRRLSFVLPIYATGDKPALLFGIGSPNNIYGFLVSGDGLIDLQMLEAQGIGQGVQSSNSYSDSNSMPVSPVYVYKHSSLNASSKDYIDIGADTKESIYIIDGTVSNAVIQYINNNQVILGNNVFDVVRLPDGEVLLFYGNATKSFNISDSALGETVAGGVKLNNSINNGSKWFNSNAVYAIGSRDDAYFWGTPTKTTIKGANEDVFQYPNMLLNSVDYLGYIYNRISDTISIFVRAFYSSYSYVGCFKMSCSTLSHALYESKDPNYNTSTPEKYPLKFFYRPPILDSSFISDKTKSWIHSDSDVINSSFVMSASNKALVQDSYVRVLGSSVANCQVKTTEDFGIISTSIMPDGSYVLWYDSSAGIKAVFSQDQGDTWVGSDLAWADQGRCGVLVGKFLLYISSDGILSKSLNSIDLSDAKSISLAKAAGNLTVSVEVNKQNYFNSIKPVLIGSGKLDYQRLSGYVTPSGIVRVFFYDSNNRLKAMETSDGFTWTVIDNF